MFRDMKVKKCIINIIMVVGVILLAILEFKFHRKFIFCRDDIWYGTNLVTGEALTGIGDVIESQIWHFMNWGGRSINHGVLQLVLMQGELFADVLNLIVTFTLCFLVCKVAGAKGILSFSLVFFMLIGLNTDFYHSMFWQSGAVNYLYATNWILLFILVYIRQLKEPDEKKLPAIELWIVPLGLITGWSNENMGPACFLAAGMVIFYFIKILKRRVPLWMWLGATSSLVGSAFLILAPGNFVRKEHVVEMTLAETLYDRFFSMAMGACSFLFPTLLFLLFFLLLYLKAGNKLEPFLVVLMLTGILAYGAMLLSPTFPNRAAFGIVVLGIILIISFVQGIRERTKLFDNCILVFSLFMWVYSAFLLITMLRMPL